MKKWYQSIKKLAKIDVLDGVSIFAPKIITKKAD